jgi:hypothetical protein
MSNINFGNDSYHVNPSISPYSILRQSNQEDVDDTIQQITMGIGPRSTRAQLLKQLALKKKISQNPFLSQRFKLSKDEAMQLSTDR